MTPYSPIADAAWLAAVMNEVVVIVPSTTATNAINFMTTQILPWRPDLFDLCRFFGVLVQR